MRGWQRTLSALHFAGETISTMQFRLRHHHTISMRMIHMLCLVSKARSRFNLRVNDSRNVSQLGLASAQDLRGGGDVTAMHLSVRYANISIPDGCILHCMGAMANVSSSVQVLTTDLTIGMVTRRATT
jgi:hypothetical protein